MTTVTLDPIGVGYWSSGIPTFAVDLWNAGGFWPTGEFGGSQCNRGWLIWDIYHIPPDAVVSAASLDLTVDSNFLGTNHTLNLYQLKRRNWKGRADTSGATSGHAEQLASWDNYRQDLTQAWGTAGADNTTTDRSGSAIGSLAITAATSGTQTITLNTAQVQAWIDGSTVNNGLVFIASVETASSNTLIRWKSHDDATPANRQRLTVTYTSATESLGITNGLEGYWKLSDTSDSSGNAHTLTNVNTTTFVPGKLGNAARFVAASNQRLTNNDAGVKPGVGDDFTCVFWAKLSDLTTLYTAVSQFSGAPTSTEGAGWRVFYHQQDILDYYVLQLNDATGNAEVCDVVGYTSGALGSPGTYHMVAVRHDAARKVFHLGFNGTMSRANSAGRHADGDQWGPYQDTYIPATSTPFAIGAEANGSGGYTQPFAGDIDNVLYWTRWLTDAEISTTLYNGGNGLEPSLVTGGVLRAFLSGGIRTLTGGIAG